MPGMSLELIHRYYRAFNAADYPGMLACLAEDVEHDINQGDRETGRTRFAAFLKRMHESYREQLSEIVVMGNPESTHFAAEFIVQGTYLKADPELPPAHGQRYRLAAGAFFEVAEGLITRVTTYYNLRDWLDQVRQP
jgi:steroid delta-isomerase-like uncharacterized protein